jgi:hypothetical protein
MLSRQEKPMAASAATPPAVPQGSRAALKTALLAVALPATLAASAALLVNQAPDPTPGCSTEASPLASEGFTLEQTAPVSRETIPGKRPRPAVQGTTYQQNPITCEYSVTQSFG